MSEPLYNLMTNVHSIRLLSSYRETLEKFALVRKGKPSGIWTLYYAPYVEEWWGTRVPNAFKKIPKRFADALKFLNKGWSDIGMSFALLTCKMAYMDPGEREQRCKAVTIDNFTQKASKGDEDDEKDDVREGFIGAIMSIASFFKSLVDVALAIAMLFANFPLDPLGTIFGLLSIIIGIIVSILLILVYMLLTFTLVAYIVILYLSIWWSLLVPWWVFLWYSLMTFLTSIAFFILWLIDLVAQGAVTKMMSCENLPDSWATSGNYVYGNIHERSTLYLGAVMTKCFSRYRPRYVLMCERMPRLVPDFCPQQQIYRFYKGIDNTFLKGPTMFTEYRPPLGFRKKGMNTRIQEMMRSYEQKREWNDTCSKELKAYDYVNMHFCSDPKAGAKLSGGNSSVLKAYCMDAYCRTRKDKLSQFCRRIDKLEMASEQGADNDASYYLAKNIVSFLLIVFVITACAHVLSSISNIIVTESKNFTPEID